MVSGLWEGQKSASLAQMKLLGLFLLMALPLMGSEWVELFDGKTLKGWNNQGDANWAVKNGEITADSGEVCLLTTSEKYKNYELVLEFKAAIGTNSGVFLNTEAKVKDEAVDCYEINIAPPSNPFPTGSIVKHHKIEKQGEKDAWRSYKLQATSGKRCYYRDPRWQRASDLHGEKAPARRLYRSAAESGQDCVSEYSDS